MEPFASGAWNLLGWVSMFLIVIGGAFLLRLGTSSLILQVSDSIYEIEFSGEVFKVMSTVGVDVWSSVT